MTRWAALLIASFLALAPVHKASACDGGACAAGLAYEAFGPKDHASTLVIFIHGSVSAGGPADYMYRFARAFSETHRDVEAIALLMPGYYDNNGKRSDGNDHGRRTFDGSTEVSNAITALKAQYGAKRVFALGHSNGAMNLGGVIGKYPGLIDGVVLVSGIYDLNAISQMRGKQYGGIAGQDYISSIARTTTIIAVHGTEDVTVPFEQSQNFIAAAKAAKLKADLKAVDGVGHDFGGPLAQTAIAALNTLVH